MAGWQEFRVCPHCRLDIGTGEGERGCALGDCAYLPEELDVFCWQCRFNLHTMEGNPDCADPLVCEHAAPARAHVQNYRRWDEDRRKRARPSA